MKKRETDETTFIELEDGDLPKSAYTHRLPVGKQATGYGANVVIQIEEAAVEILGDHGRLLSMSKSTYKHEHPDHTVYFNACIFDGSHVGRACRRRAHQIWFGDLDLTLEADKLQELADRLGHPIVVTPETPYRFKGLPGRPKRLDAAPEIFIIRPRQGSVS